MSITWEGTKKVVIRLLAKATSGPGFLANGVKTATLSVASALATALRLGVARDLNQLKEDGLRRSKAKTDAEEAKARELVAKAIEAENKAQLVKRNDRISKAKEAQTRAAAAKTNAQDKAIQQRAEEEALKGKVDAFAKFVHAMNILKKRNGAVGVDPKELMRMLCAETLKDAEFFPLRSLPAKPKKRKPGPNFYEQDKGSGSDEETRSAKRPKRRRKDDK